MAIIIMYVAFSRARSMASVKVKVVNTNQQGKRGTIMETNVVFSEIVRYCVEGHLDSPNSIGHRV